MPTIYIIAGPNGVGKTTFANRYLPEEARELEFVNADLIARGLSPFDPDRHAVEAGRIVLKRIHTLIEDRASFTWETTLSGKSALVWLRAAKARGFMLKCYFLWVRHAETTLDRIRQRVQEGGHNIPADVVRRRFLKTATNFFQSYIQVMDTWKFFANSGQVPRLIAAQKAGRLVVRDQGFLDSLLAQIGVQL